MSLGNLLDCRRIAHQVECRREGIEIVGGDDHDIPMRRCMRSNREHVAADSIVALTRLRATVDVDILVLTGPTARPAPGCGVTRVVIGKPERG